MAAGVMPGSSSQSLHLAAALGTALSSILIVQPLEEPGHQSPAADDAAAEAHREPGQDEDRDRPQVLVQPVPGECAASTVKSRTKAISEKRAI